MDSAAIPLTSGILQEAQALGEDGESWAGGTDSVGGTSVEREKLVEPVGDLGLPGSRIHVFLSKLDKWVLSLKPIGEKRHRCIKQ